MMAVAQAWDAAIAACLASPVLTAADIAAIKAVTTGGMEITYNPHSSSATLVFTALNFSSVTTIEDIAKVIDDATDANLGCGVMTLPGGSKIIVIATTAVGDNTTIQFAANHTTGTAIAALLKLTAATGGKVRAGYTPTDMAGELDNIQAAAQAAGEFIYGWDFDVAFRTTQVQEVAAAWDLAQNAAVMEIVTNSADALDSSVTSDIGSILQPLSNYRVDYQYHDDADYYPGMSILAYMLSVNYLLQDSAVTAKFKVLPGIPTVAVTLSQWLALKAKGYNTYTAIGNSTKTYREGTTGDAPTYFLDDTINLDNFKEDLQVNVFNVFLRNPKVPYNRTGQQLLVDACNETGNQYVHNGTFSDREVADTTKKSGAKIIPAYQTIPTPISSISTAIRASRIGPPIQMIVQMAEAMHEVAIAVSVVK